MGSFNLFVLSKNRELSPYVFHNSLAFVKKVAQACGDLKQCCVANNVQLSSIRCVFMHVFNHGVLPLSKVLTETSPYELFEPGK